MKNLIFIALFLHLVIFIREINGKYQFGDIIVFPRACPVPGGKPTYNHYAVYVGPKSGVDVGQNENQDIFHRTGSLNKLNCRFDTLKDVTAGSKVEKFNFLDDIEPYQQGEQDEIKHRIAEAMKNCRKYELFTNNCEHFATCIRYGKGLSLQIGAVSEGLVAIQGPARALVDKVKANIKEEARCERD